MASGDEMRSTDHRRLAAKAAGAGCRRLNAKRSRSSRNPFKRQPATGRLKSLAHHAGIGGSPKVRRIKVLLVISAAFFFLWVGLKAMDQADLWPLLAAPILLSAWFFYEAGVLVAVVLAALLLVQTSFEKSPALIIALATFTATGIGLGWGQRQQKLAHRHTLRSSITDSLTGLYNYGHFMQCLDREIHRAGRYGGAVTLVMFDVDHFKQFNDRFGHQAGNDALRAVADILRSEKRESDIAARFGGEEFVLLIPGDESAGIETAGRLRRAISQTIVPVGGGASSGITVSAGVASYPLGASSREELLDRVDQLLYVSKNAGRNRVSIAHNRQRLAVS